jgi:NADH dehydrogenase FAD-containing subunit
MPDQPHVVILGAGFGGIGALKSLGDANVSVTVIDKRDYHTFQPLLYQVATDELAPVEVGFPIRNGAEQKSATFVDWGWNVLTRKRGKRIILSPEDTETAPPPNPASPK